MLKNGFLTFCCAFIPGAGQMYQGYMKRGLSLILTACLIGMVSSLLNPVLLLLVVSTLTPATSGWPGLCWTATSWWAGCSSPSVRSSPTRTSS